MNIEASLSQYKRQLRLLEQRIKSIDMTKVKPSDLGALTNAVTVLKERIKEKEEHLTKRREERAKSAPPAPVAPVSTAVPVETEKQRQEKSLDDQFQWDEEGKTLVRHEMAASKTAASVDTMDPFLRQYLETALWSSNDNADESGGDPLDRNYGPEDVSEESVAKAKADCDLFRQMAGSLLDGLDETDVAHDFWLTRNGHGAGFWDGDYEKALGKQLTDLAKQFGGQDFVVGDDKQLYLEGGSSPDAPTAPDTNVHKGKKAAKRTIDKSAILLKTYRVRLLNEELLKELGVEEWHKDIIANDLAGAWAKFKKQKMAPIFQAGTTHGEPIASDYDIHFEGSRSANEKDDSWACAECGLPSGTCGCAGAVTAVEHVRPANSYKSLGQIIAHDDKHVYVKWIKGELTKQDVGAYEWKDIVKVALPAPRKPKKPAPAKAAPMDEAKAKALWSKYLEDARNLYNGENALSTATLVKVFKEEGYDNDLLEAFMPYFKKWAKGELDRVNTSPAVERPAPKPQAAPAQPVSPQEMSEEELAAVIAKELGEEDVVVALDSGWKGNTFTAGGIEYKFWWTEEEAEQQAVEQVRQDLRDEPGIFNQDWLQHFVTITPTDKRIIAGEEADNMVDDVLDAKEIVERANMTDEYRVADDEEQERILEEAKDTVRSQISDDIESRLDDPIQYFCKDQGMYSEEDLLKANFISIDVDGAAQDAVSTDGWPHFLSRYDGNMETLSNGIVYVREN